MSQIAEVRVENVDAADAAVRWLTASNRMISATTVDGKLVLRSSSLTVQKIEEAWLCALTNERLLLANAAMRAGLIADLIE